MKKIKKTFKSKKLNQKPNIALLIHAEQRHKMTTLMVDWYQDIRQELADKVNLSIHVASVADLEYQSICAQKEIHWISINAANRGEMLNQGLQALQNQELHAVVNLKAGDFLSQTLLSTYTDHIVGGGFFSGLLDQYLFDPNEFKCMYWPRAEQTQGLNRVCELGYIISTEILDAVQWTLWPVQDEFKVGSLHLQMMQRLEKLFKRCSKGSCLLKTMKGYEGVAVNLKSELARALFEEKNWQHYPGLEFVDFETVFEEHTSQEWLDQISDFDERLHLDIVLESSEHDILWRTHYEFCIYKFLPYAEVRLHLITEEDTEDTGNWIHHHSSNSTRGQKWNQVLHTLKGQSSDLVLFAGAGGLVDLKTIEHYLIYIFKKGARLLSVQNFFVADSENHDIYFWRGNEFANFDNSLGFATCIHRYYLDQVDWDLFTDDLQLNSATTQKLSTLLNDTKYKHQRVFFQCAAHKLGLLTFDIHGSMIFEHQIKTSDLQKVDFMNYLPDPCFNLEMKKLLSDWTGNALNSEHTFDQLPAMNEQNNQPSQLSLNEESNMSSSMSPLERAKALLQKTQATNQAEEAPTETVSEAQTTQPLSALGRAKALLQKTQATNPSKESSADDSSKTQVASSESTLSPLEKAKALLRESQPAAAPAKPKSASVQTNVDSQEKPLSALERAKALLQQTHNPSAVSEEDKKEDQSLIQNTISAAEDLMSKLQTVKEAALKQVEEEKAKAQHNQAGDLLCQQGEDAFVSGQLQTARTLFESALLIQKNSVRAMNNLGVLALQEGEIGAEWQALSYFLLAMVHEMDHPDVVQNLSDLFQGYPSLSVAQKLIFDA